MEIITSRQEIAEVVKRVLREYPGLKLDKQAQFFNFMVKAGRKMTDSDLKMVIESIKRRVGERNGEQG